MKPTFFYSALLIILCCTAFTVLNEPEKDILGQWRIDESVLDKTTSAIIEFARKTNPEMAAQMDERYELVKEMIGGSIFEYKADHTYEITTPQGPQVGTWSFEENFKLLKHTREGRPDRTDKVIEISATKFKVVNGDRGDTTLFIRP